MVAKSFLRLNRPCAVLDVKRPFTAAGSARRMHGRRTNRCVARHSCRKLKVIDKNGFALHFLSAN